MPDLVQSLAGTAVPLPSRQELMPPPPRPPGRLIRATGGAGMVQRRPTAPAPGPTASRGRHNRGLHGGSTDRRDPGPKRHAGILAAKDISTNATSSLADKRG